jgi:hypothetical protein
MNVPFTFCNKQPKHPRPTVFTPSTPLAVGVLRVRRACEGGAQSDCSFRCHRRVPPSSHLLHAPPSSHRRLHWPSASCACAAPLARPTVFTPSRSTDGEEVDESEGEGGSCPEGSDFAAEEGYEEGGPNAEEGYEEVWDEVQEALSTMGHEEYDETAETSLCARSQASRPSSAASSQASVLS